MACKTLEDIIPVSSLGFGAVDTLIKKIPQIQPGKTKGWKDLQKAMSVALWLSNPSNIAAIKQVADAIKRGDLSGLILISNLLSYVGMDGMINFSALGSKLSKVSEALDCVNQNINALSNIENQVVNTVQGVLTTSNVFAMLGLSDVMDSLGITDSYAFSQLQSEMNSKLGFVALSSVPGINGIVPIPQGLSQVEQAYYSANSLTQTMYLLSQAPTDPVAQEALQKTAQASTLISPSVAELQISTLPSAANQLITGAIENKSDVTTLTIETRSSNAQALSALTSSVQAQTGVTTPGVVPAPPIPGPGGQTQPMGVETASALQAQGPTAIGNLQDATNKTQLLKDDNKERIIWKQRQLNILKGKYQKQFYQVDKDIKEVSSMTSQVPLIGGQAPDLSPLLSLLQSRNPVLSEHYRVLDFKLKLIKYDLESAEGEISSSNADSAQLGTYSSGLQYFSPVNGNPYSASDPRTAGRIPITNRCGWVSLDPTIQGFTLAGVGRQIQVTFMGGVSNSVQPAFKSWLQSVIASSSRETDIRSITISSVFRGGDSSSYHSRGSAVDIAAINGISVSSIGTSRPVSSIQVAARSAGVHENFGPYTMQKDGSPYYGNTSLTSSHRNHIHMSLRLSNQTCSATTQESSSAKGTPSGLVSP